MDPALSHACLYSVPFNFAYPKFGIVGVSKKIPGQYLVVLNSARHRTPGGVRPSRQKKKMSYHHLSLRGTRGRTPHRAVPLPWTTAILMAVTGSLRDRPAQPPRRAPRRTTGKLTNTAKAGSHTATLAKGPVKAVLKFTRPPLSPKGQVLTAKLVRA